MRTTASKCMAGPRGQVTHRLWRRGRVIGLGLLLLAALACGDGETSEEAPAAGGGEKASRGGPPGGSSSGGGPPSGARGRGGRGGPPGGFGGFGGPAEERGVPVEVTVVERRAISSYFETQGTLEAENEVDLVARLSGPVEALETEEGRRVRKGQLLARLDDRELRAQLEVAQVRLDETQRNYDRVKSLHDSQLVSQEAFDGALAEYDSARGDFERTRLQLEYTEIRAPFGGQIVERYVRLAEHVQTGAALFRLSDFDPLLCRIQVPERELPRLSVGQRAELQVEAWPERRFEAQVLRVSPVVDAGSGTVRVTLEVSGEGDLRPGMFATIFLEMERREDALVIPKSALALDSLGDTIFVVEEETAQRRTLELGFRSDDLLEVRSGLDGGEQAIVVGQDGLGEGTPVEVLGERPLPGSAASGDPSAETEQSGGRGEGRSRRSREDSGGSAGGSGFGGPAVGGPAVGGPGGGGPGGGGGPAFFRNLDWDDPKQVEQLKDRMRQRGLSDAEIEERLKVMRQRMGGG